ncbi:hypothetical protein TWF694_003598 [Orbilia ellipsospora]|uniref:F-box domain-containing protein n=1 Tax=Orbilia ellipsospora TaxID=2528407 RepID=A0AAV9X150_9PEZI
MSDTQPRIFTLPGEILSKIFEETLEYNVNFVFRDKDDMMAYLNRVSKPRQGASDLENEIHARMIGDPSVAGDSIQQDIVESMTTGEENDVGYTSYYISSIPPNLLRVSKRFTDIVKSVHNRHKNKLTKSLAKCFEEGDPTSMKFAEEPPNEELALKACKAARYIFDCALENVCATAKALPKWTCDLVKVVCLTGKVMQLEVDSRGRTATDISYFSFQRYSGAPHNMLREIFSLDRLSLYFANGTLKSHSIRILDFLPLSMSYNYEFLEIIFTSMQVDDNDDELDIHRIAATPKVIATARRELKAFYYYPERRMGTEELWSRGIYEACCNPLRLYPGEKTPGKLVAFEYHLGSLDSLLEKMTSDI